MAYAGWWNHGARPVLKSEGAVSQDVAACDIGDGVVSSEKATANLRSRSVLLFCEAATSTEAAGVAAAGTTAIVAWRPGVNINVTRIAHVTLGAWQNATCDNLTLYGNAGTCIGDIGLKAASTAIARGVRTAGGSITQAALAAGTDVLVKQNLSTCSVSARSAVQIDYETSN